MTTTWKIINDIIMLDEEYDNFRTKVKQFMVDNNMSLLQLSNKSGISRPVIITFLRGDHRGLSFKTVTRLYNFMQEFQKQNGC